MIFYQFSKNISQTANRQSSLFILHDLIYNRKALNKLLLSNLG